LRQAYEEFELERANIVAQRRTSTPLSRATERSSSTIARSIFAGAGWAIPSISSTRSSSPA